MSNGFAMVALRRRRGTFIVLIVVCVAAFFAVGVFGAKALEQSRIDAQATAKGLATAGVGIGPVSITRPPMAQMPAAIAVSSM